MVSMNYRERKKEIERQRQRETDRQRERQTDRQTDRGRERDREREAERVREVSRAAGLPIRRVRPPLILSSAIGAQPQIQRARMRTVDQNDVFELRCFSPISP